MSSDHYLPLLLDGPFQAWGHGSRFMRRTTGLYPSKSGVIGLILAAMGRAKGSGEEGESLRELNDLHMTVIVLPRPKPGIRRPRVGAAAHWLEPRRLEDYHTVAFTREANAPLKRIGELEAKCLNPISPGDRASEIKPTHRQYLLDARFGVLLRGKGQVLKSVAATLQNPCWGVWLGRKNCIPAKPLFVGGPFEHAEEAWQALRQKAALPADFLQEQFTQVVEAADGTDSFDDHPVSFGNGKSSGPESRQFVPRRVKIISRSQ
jgi:CRISPR system Cascade subunit CasD